MDGPIQVKVPGLATAEQLSGLYRIVAELFLYPEDRNAARIQAGRAAGMATLAAAWGYLGQGEPIEDWGADAVLPEPAALLHWLGLA